MIHSASTTSKRPATISVKKFTGARQVRLRRRFSHGQNYNARFSCHRDDELRRPGRFAESGRGELWATYRGFCACRRCGMVVALPGAMLRSRSSWLRVLRLYDAEDAPVPAAPEVD